MRKILTVRKLKEDLELHTITKEEFLDRIITSSYFTTGGLEISNFFNFFIPGNVICYGKNEIGYLNSLPFDIRKLRLQKLFLLQPGCIITTAPRISIPSEMLKLANKFHIPVLITARNYHQMLTSLDFYLTRFFAPEKKIHGTFLEVFGLGVLILGDSGIGKSECALELIKRGHRLICDDIVTIKKIESGFLIGMGNELTKYHMEIRGIGIVNIKSLFGIGAVLEEKSLDLVIEFEFFNPEKKYDRLGLEEEFFEIFGIKVPKKRIPVQHGKNLSIVVETAVLNQHLKYTGEDTAKKFINKLEEFL